MGIRLEGENSLNEGSLVLELAQLKKKVVDQDLELKRMREEQNTLMNNLEKFLTKTQLKRIILNCNTLWTDEDITRALTIRNLGIKTYTYFRQELQMPLPSLSTLNRRISSIKVEPGILKAVIRVMS